MRHVKIVGLLVKDYDPAIAFHSQKLAFRVVEDQPLGDRRWITLSLPDDRCMLAFELAAPLRTSHSWASKAAASHSSPSILRNCIADFKAMKSRGVLFYGEPKTGPWGTGVLLEDLYGNRLFLSQET